jgi:hypothetical protein
MGEMAGGVEAKIPSQASMAQEPPPPGPNGCRFAGDGGFKTLRDLWGHGDLLLIPADRQLGRVKLEAGPGGLSLVEITLVLLTLGEPGHSFHVIKRLP